MLETRTDYFMLDDFINAKWLSADIAAALRATFSAGPDRLLVLDDFLRPEPFAAMEHSFREDCEWATCYGLRDRVPHLADAEAYAASRPENRLFMDDNFRRALPGRAFAPGILALVKFRSLLASAEFRDLLCAWTGVVLPNVNEVLIRRMGSDAFADWHSDAIEDRRICILLYFNQGWRPGFGGDFRLRTGGDQSIVFAPLPNRALIFDVTTGQKHRVDPRGPEAGDWQRHNLTIWLGDGGTD